MFSFKRLILISSILAFSQLGACAFAAASSLPDDEVQALRDIAGTIGKKDWDFSVDPCSGQLGWATTSGRDGFQNYVSCNCSFTDAPHCHVVSIVLTEQSLQGKLPPQLVRLPYLQVFHLNDNYLNGTLPPEWGSTQLVHIALAANQISGSIPQEFGNIHTLVNLTLESNQLSGGIPPELGNLVSIRRLILSSNYLSGELPASLGKLVSLKDLWIGDNQFTGQIPDYIGNWTNLERLLVQGSGMDGPIPSSIASLVNLKDLRISDLNGTEQPFPPLDNMKNLTNLVLRSCSITDVLPAYLGNIKILNTLDLSFNKLSGEIPSNYSNLANTHYIYLTGNMLSGPVPDWMLKTGGHIDLSYNNFTVESSGSCQHGNVNLFGSSLYGNNSIVPCLRSFHCPQNSYSLHINCAGEKVTANGNTMYEDDTNSGGPSNFFQSSPNWAFSNTGHFMDNTAFSNLYINTTNITSLSMTNPELYSSARLSPISLTYYGLCLENGNYGVNLHFAEIVFTDDETYSSLGRRIFDIYIQGKLVQKDFNIAAEAGGNGKAIIKNFPTPVFNNTLEIRLYWAGKGSSGLPYRGVYGPLISAISVEPEHKSALSIYAKVGIGAAVVSIILLVLGVLWWKGCINICQRNTKSQDQKGHPQNGPFTLAEIKAATKNFHAPNIIGEGGFGPVYKGLLSNGTVIAVKQLSSKSNQGNREFVNEVGMISALQHPHLVKLYGCCIEENQLLLVYEYLENNSLARALFGPKEHQIKLDWPTRHMICVGIAKGLAFLHEESRLKVVHRDIKATNVLLDKDLTPKISDFGLAKLDEEDRTHISTRIAGTYGYMAPEYQMRGYLTDKADVYSFGIVALEIVSGRSIANQQRTNGESCNILGWALNLKWNGNGSLMELVDPRLGSNLKEKEAMDMINVALLCTNISPKERPTMSSVVTMLQGTEAVPELPPNSNVTRNEAMKRQLELIGENSIEVEG